MTLAHVLSSVFQLYLTNSFKNFKYDSIPGMLQANCYMILGGTITITTYIYNGSRMRLLQDLARVSSLLSKTSFNKLARWIHAKDFLFFIALVGQTPNIISKSLLDTFCKTISMYTTLVVFLMDFHYSNCVLVLKSCFKNVNDNLTKLKENIVIEDLYLLKRVSNHRPNPLLLVKLRELMSVHFEISAIVREVNSTFCLQINVSVLMTFAEVTFSLYFYLLQSHGATHINLEKQIWYSYFVTSVAYYSLKLAIMTWICQTTKDEASKTGVIAHEILINIDDTSFKEEVS